MIRADHDFSAPSAIPSTGFADLHLHTFFSDGTYSPEELVRHAAGHGLAAIALTDHDTVEGCERLTRAATEFGVTIVPGSELTAEAGPHEVHILGYFLDTNSAPLLEKLSHFQTARQERIREMVRLLNQYDIALTAESVFALANCRSPGRPHVGRALVQGGFCRTMDEAFDRFLKKDRPAWVPKAKMSASEGIELIHRSGGVAVLAHPALNRTDSFIPALVEAGLDGIECFHSKHSASDSRRYQEVAKRFNLVVTGGSDCHGQSKGKPLIGGVKLPIQHVAELQERRQHRSAAR